jgi:hypothetical protein
MADLSTPSGLLEDLAAIFPEFQDEWEPHEVPGTFHEVMLSFTSFFGTRASTSSQRELARLGELVNRCVATGGPLENAVATCFLEHLHQIRAWPILKPYLSDLARRLSHA